MTMREPQAAPPRPAGQLGGMLADLDAQLERTMAGLSENRLEARRQITRELGFEPRPAQLQLFVRLAGLGDDAPVVLRTMTREIIRARLLADRDLRELDEMQPLDPQELERIARRLPEVRATAVAAEQDLHQLLAVDDAVDPDTRQELLRVAEAFAAPRDELTVASLIAPRLAELAAAARDGAPAGLLASLRERHLRWIEQSVHVEGVEFGDRPSRVCLDATALATLIEDDLARWAAQPRFDESSGADKAQRTARVERLKLLKLACGVVSERLQRKQDEALVAGLDGYADDLRSAGRGLFSLSLKLAPILRNPNADPAREDAPAAGRDAPEEQVAELLAEASAADRAADAARSSQISEEEVYLDALNDLRRPNARPLLGLRRRRGRGKQDRLRRVLLAVAGALAVAAVVVQLVLPGMPRDLPELTAADLSSSTGVARADNAGAMLFAQINDWDALDGAARVARVQAIGLEAAPKGIRALIVTDGGGALVARWSESEGVVLTER